jgi:hypothetical protein
MIGYIYLVTNMVNGKQYIGSTIKKVSIRWTTHKCAARKGSNYLFHKAIRKYGENNFKLETIFCSKDIKNLEKYEDQFIKEYKTLYLEGGYNRVFATESRTYIQECMRNEWKNPQKRKIRLKKMREGSSHRFKAILGISIYNGSIIKYENIHDAIRDGFAVSAIYFSLTRKDKTGQKYVWFYNTGKLDCYYKKEALKLLGSFKEHLIRPVIAINLITNETKEYKSLLDVKVDGFKPKIISRICRKKYDYDNYRGFKWKFK